MAIQQKITKSFERRYGQTPELVVRAPGRVNLIGEHTDYNDGFVLPMAIDREIWIALRPRHDRTVEIQSLDFDEPITFTLDELTRGESSPAEYVKGVAWVLQESGYGLKGWEGVMKGDIPIGAGLSSSAALELATACAFAAVSDIDWDAPQMAKLAQKAENEWVGVNCGIMDQMISAAGQAGHALLIDCRSLETQLAPLPPDTAVVVLDTGTRRGLMDSAYNERRTQCEAAASFFGVPALRNVKFTEFEARASGLDDVTLRRARHIITENHRTQQAKDAMFQGDAATMGTLMNASHESLRDDFEVSSDALNAIVECAHKHEGCYGARLTGAGFGGCAVALVQLDAVQDFTDYVVRCYAGSTDNTPQVYICQATGGANIVSTTL